MMNIYGHEKTIKVLIRQEKFWLECGERGSSKDYLTAERVCENHAAGERAKIRWHKSEIKRLKGAKK